MTSRHNFWVRSIGGVAGDYAVGYALASACIWIIQTASLGLFLSFLLWIVAALLALAVSQYVVRPSLSFLLADDKLDRGIAALSGLATAAQSMGIDLRSPLAELRQRMSRFARAAAR
jgi:hypothetical protein